jgi:hypothetical protein
VNGADVRRRREELQLSRPQLVDRLRGASISRMTVGILAGIEVRSDEIRVSEVSIWQRALGLSTDGSEAEEPPNERPAGNGHRQVSKRPVWAPAEAEIRFEWCGLKSGDIIRVEGCPRAYFEFRFFYRDDHQEFVEVYGGKRSHEKVRAFRPERLRTTRGRRIYVGAGGEGDGGQPGAVRAADARP